MKVTVPSADTAQEAAGQLPAAATSGFLPMCMLETAAKNGEAPSTNEACLTCPRSWAGTYLGWLC